MKRFMMAVLVLCVFAIPVEASSAKSSSKSFSKGFSSGSGSSKSSKKSSKPSKSFGSFSGGAKQATSASTGVSTPPPKAAAFGTFGNAPKPAPQVALNPPTSALSGDLSKQSAHAAALNTLDAGNRQADTQNVASMGSKYSATGTPPPANAAAAQAPVYANNAPQPQTVIYNNGGSDHSFWWYTLGHFFGEHDRDNHAAQAQPQPAPGAQSYGNTAAPSGENEPSSSGRVLVWLMVILLLGGLGYYVYRKMSNNQDQKEEQAGNYTL